MGLGHVNSIVSLPSGPRPGNLTCGPPEKNRPRKTNPRGKKKTNAASPRSLPASGQKKHQMPPRKKKEPQRANPCCRLTAQRPRAAFSLLAGVPHQAPPRKSYLRASRKENRSRKTNRRGKKQTILDLFFLLASDDKPTIKFTFPNLKKRSRNLRKTHPNPA